MIAEQLVALGAEHQQAGRIREAEALYRRALQNDSHQPEAHCNLGILAHQAGRFQESLSHLNEAIRLRPHFALALTNLGVVLRSLGRYDEALEMQQQALALAPGSAVIHHNLGTLLRSSQRLDEAQAAFEEALRLKPGFPDAAFGLSALHLLRGDFEMGFQQYECRWDLEGGKGRRSFSAPTWKGESLKGKTLLLWAEQGLGDSIQFVRMAKCISEGRVLLEAPLPLAELFKTAEGISEIIPAGATLPTTDFQLPLLSLPRLLNLKPETIPGDVPYLRPDPEKVRAWQDRLATRLGPRIGLCWRGSSTFVTNRERSIPAAILRDQLPLDRYTWIGLCKDAPAADLEALPEVLHVGPELNSMADTAALISCLDLVITTDTSVAHLSGALGAKTCVLLSHSADWRWMLDRTDSPWYPTMRLFRQANLNAWESCLNQVVEGLDF